MMRKDLSFWKFYKTAEITTVLDSHRKKEMKGGDQILCGVDYMIKEAFQIQE